MAGKTLKVVSIDYDGCLNHRGFQQALEDDPDRPMSEVLIENNPVMMKYLADNQIGMVMIGSNRQDIDTDFMNSKKKVFATGKTYEAGSIFPMLEAVSKKIDATFSPFVLADVYADKEEGHSYQRAQQLQATPNQYPDSVDIKGEPKWTFDEQKVSIIYAQIQKLALEHPDDAIEFTFIDDRTDILGVVENFFEKHPEMIPANVTLKTQQYYNANPDRLSTVAEMQIEERRSFSSAATTKANPLYKETLKSWAMKNSEMGALKADAPETPYDFHQAYDNLVTEHQQSLQQSQSFLARATATINSALAGARTVGKNLWEAAKQLGNNALQNMSSLFGSARTRGNTIVESVRERGNTVLRTVTNAEGNEKKQAIAAAMDEMKAYASQYNKAKGYLRLQQGFPQKDYPPQQMLAYIKQMQEAIEKLKTLKIPEGMEHEAKKDMFTKADFALLQNVQKKNNDEDKTVSEVKVCDALCKDITERFLRTAKTAEPTTAKAAEPVMAWKKASIPEQHSLQVNAEVRDPHAQQQARKEMSEIHHPEGSAEDFLDEAKSPKF